MKTPKFRKLPKTRKFRLEGREDQHGNVGWILAGMADFDAGTGLTVAHDVLEHFSHVDNDGASEYEAFGCIVWGRLMGGYWHSRPNSFYAPTRSPEQVLAYDLADFYHRLPVCPEAPAWVENPDVREVLEDAEEPLSAIAEHLTRMLSVSDEFGEPLEGEDLNRAVTSIMGWVKAGYFRAEKVFSEARIRPEEWSWLFQQIGEDIDKNFTHPEPGEVIMITIEYGTPSYTIRRGIIDERGRVNYSLYE